MRSFPAVSTLLLLSVSLSASVAHAAEPTTIYLVRHAEKVLEPKTDDPLLTAVGTKRAEALAKVLRDAGISAIYATEYKRTQLTVAPLAAALKLTPVVFSSKDAKAFAKLVLDKSAGKTVLVAGHSNTVPDIMKELGVKDAPAIDDAHYDNLFVVVRREGEVPKLLRLHYGD
jgi:broad specificity phosphatase PhoE